MLENYLITIIVPNYNHEKYLVQRLDSIFNQTYTHFEVILMDDCSTDNSLEILKTYSKHEKVTTCVFNEVNTGNTFKQWAKGISLAKGEFIWIAESDDYCECNFLEKLIQPLLQDKEIVLAYCQSNRVNEYSKVTGNWITHTADLHETLFLKDFIWDSNKFIEEFLICKNVIPNASAVVLRKSVIDVDSHFDLNPEFRYCGDWMFYFKLICNKKVAFISDSLNNFRYHSTSVIANAVKNEKRIRIIDIDYRMRIILMDYLKQNPVNNLKKIKYKNYFIKRNYLIYEKAFILIRSGNKIKGYILLITVFDLFYKNYKFKKNIRIKIKRLFS